MTTATHMLPRDMQLSNEHRFSRQHIDRYIRREILDNPDMAAKVDEGVARIDHWLRQDYYASKNERLAQLQGLDLWETVLTVYVGVAYCQVPELFTSVTAQLAGALKMSEKGDSILTLGEMLAVLCLTDVFDIDKASAASSLVVQSHIPLSDRLLDYVHNARYLPPMVCEPEPVGSNFESPYLTHNDCLVLGKGNGHTEDICLDVINTQNQVALCLNLEMLCQIEEEPNKPITIETVMAKARKKGEDLSRPAAAQRMRDQLDHWQRFKAQSYETYDLLAKQGNRFWLAHKVDKRGRLYAQGYHVSTQGSSFKKSTLDFADKEVIEGVPDCCRVATTT